MYVVCVVFKAAVELRLDDDAYNRQACSRMRIVAVFHVRISRKKTVKRRYQLSYGLCFHKIKRVIARHHDGG